MPITRKATKTPADTVKPGGERPRDGCDYGQCFKDAVALGVARRERHRGKSSVPREPKFEQDIIGVVAECAFAQFAGLSTAPIYEVSNGTPDFLWHSRTIDVKAYGFDPERPHRKCNLLVRTSDAVDHPADFYVLWSVNVDDLSQHEPIGWATLHQVITAPIKVISTHTNLANYTLHRGELARIADLQPRILSLSQDWIIHGDVVLLAEWTPDKLSARISLTDVARTYRQTIDHIYRGTSVNPERGTLFHSWHIASGGDYDRVDEAIAAIRSRHTPS